ncbi:MAG: branched-chain amino acid ABC transporter permease [Anaerolineae bacterium]|jgi:branched-chain amino acid transport system permease protein|nr:branched-chain amino acid ABC transporter permease [Anaerolineae bacterium]MBT7075068.1 branched-chain amino acid ABC transporter permease [Anaerolineae bacterium]MBT7781966.1 branched-chain amino acid ABC transporter permease [Anaerolineae bacterium]
MSDRIKQIDFLGVIMWFFRTSLIVAMLWGTIATLLNNPYSARAWTDTIVAGIAQGSLYALIAIGYTLVYGVLFMINFAHGEFFMSGIMTASVFLAVPMSESGYLDAHPVLGITIIAIVTMLVSVGIAILTERIAYKPLRGAPRLVPLITAIGASFFWQYFFRGLYGSKVRPFPLIESVAGKVNIGGIDILKSQVIVIIVTLIMLVGLYLFVVKTKVGKSIRAAAENKDVARLMGIDVDRAITITFTMGAAMAGIAGVLYALVFRQVHFFMGFFPGIKAFTAAVLGGIGSIPGAALGGLFLGVFESVGPGLFLEGLGVLSPHQLKDIIAFTMLVLVLIFRPQGILGESLAEEKA